MIGAIIGDVVGSFYEFRPAESKDFELFCDKSHVTDDTVLSVATADVLMNGLDYAKSYQKYARKYPHRGYGGNFLIWTYEDDPQPYNSYGNGSAMRVSPIAYAFDTMEEVRAEARRSAMVTHNHPEGIKGAESTASCVFAALQGWNKDRIRKMVVDDFGYDLDRTCDDIRSEYHFDVTCQGSVPESIIAFLESESFEDAVRLAVSLGGDADTMACIAGGIAEAYYKEIPKFMADEVFSRMDDDLRGVVDAFCERYHIDY